MNKLRSYDQLAKDWANWQNLTPRDGKFRRGYLRFGQYVWNMYDWEEQSWPELFYEIDPNEAIMMLTIYISGYQS